MKNLIPIFFFLFSAIFAVAQPVDIETSEGNLTITPILHATMVMEWDGKTIFMDPYGGAEKLSDWGAPDLVVITHAHGDHLNPETLSGLDLSNTELVAPQSVVDELGDITFGTIHALANGEEMDWQSVLIKAVPMYNLPVEDARHAPGWGNGYVLTFGDKRVYVSGDTEDIPEMRQLEDIDAAFVCMNLPYTMTVEQAADAVIEFGPDIVFPFHYRGQGGFSDVKKFKQLVNAGNEEVEVRLLEWYPAE